MQIMPVREHLKHKARTESLVLGEEFKVTPFNVVKALVHLFFVYDRKDFWKTQTLQNSICTPSTSVQSVCQLWPLELWYVPFSFSLTCWEGTSRQTLSKNLALKFCFCLSVNIHISSYNMLRIVRWTLLILHTNDPRAGLNGVKSQPHIVACGPNRSQKPLYNFFTSYQLELPRPLWLNWITRNVNN